MFNNVGKYGFTNVFHNIIDNVLISAFGSWYKIIIGNKNCEIRF